MWRKMACAGAGLIAASATAYFIPSSGGLSVVRSESFEARWLAAELAARPDRLKQDRLAPPRAAPSIVFSFKMPGANTTVVTKHLRVPARPADLAGPNGAGQAGNDSSRRPALSPVREIPHESKRKKKLPVGCEPSFSPVAVPAMAHVSGRCVS